MNTRRTPPKVKRPTPVPVVQTPAVAFEAFKKGAATPVATESAPNKQIVSFFLESAQAEQVLLFANRITDERDLNATLMQQDVTTGVWHLSLAMDSNWQASYGFVVKMAEQAWPWKADDAVSIRESLDQAEADPRNPQRCANRGGNQLSLVRLKDAPPQPWLLPRSGVTPTELTSVVGPGGRLLWIYSSTNSPDAQPLVLVLDGEVWVNQHDLPTTMDNVVADRAARPPLMVFVDSSDREQRWRELDGEGHLGSWLVTELLPWLRERYNVTEHAHECTVVGQSLGGLTALRVVTQFPHLIANAVSQSAALWNLNPVELAEHDLSDARLVLQVGEQEWVLRQPHHEVARALQNAGARVDLQEYNGGHDYAWWRGGVADALAKLLH